MSALLLMLYQHSLLRLELCLSETLISLSLHCCGHVDTDETVAIVLLSKCAAVEAVVNYNFEVHVVHRSCNTTVLQVKSCIN